MPLRCLKHKTGAAVLASACALVSVSGWAADIGAPPASVSKHSEAASDPAIDAAVDVAADVAADVAVDASGRSIDVAALALRLRSARYVLLGEIHDNAAQHRLRAALLRALLADGRPTRVVFEQIDREHNAAVAAAGRDTEAVVSAGQLDKKGWRWPLHRPLFNAALVGGASVVGGNLSRAEASGVVRGGVALAPADLQRWLTAPDPADGSPAAWTATQDALLRQQVDTGHCGALPPAMIAPMALAQRARDAALAAAMTSAPPSVRVVLIAGNGHVRRDIGVPHYLAAAPTEGVVSIAFLERAEEGAMVADGPYDEAWFTARVERPDPCAAFHLPRVAR